MQCSSSIVCRARTARTTCLASSIPFAMSHAGARDIAAEPSGSEASGASLWASIKRVYEAAILSGAATRTETGLSALHCASSGVPFLIRTSTALQAKAKGPGPPKARPADWKNPFLPYDEALWVQHLSASHTLLLNKFNLVAHHVLIVTRDFQSQDDALNAADLEATSAVLQAIPTGGLAYFNHGPLSGMSQPHKHLQVVPLPLDDAAASPAPPVHPLVAAALEGRPAGECCALNTLPFQAYGCRLPPRPSGEALATCYEGLLAAAGVTEASHAGSSYNWLMTAEWMMLVPRGAEYFGPVTVNSLGYAGTFFVRSTEEMDFVTATGPMAVLAGMGKPWEA